MQVHTWQQVSEAGCNPHGADTAVHAPLQAWRTSESLSIANARQNTQNDASELEFLPHMSFEEWHELQHLLGSSETIESGVRADSSDAR